MNRYLSAFILTAPMAVVTPYATAQSHPAQVQTQQSIDTVLKTARDSSLSEQQKIKQTENYANCYLDYERISVLTVSVPRREFTNEQKSEFTDVFKEMTIGMYSHSVPVGVADTQVGLLPKMTASDSKLDVFSEIQTKSSAKYGVVCRLYQSGPIYKVCNTRLDGASLVTIYHNQPVELIKQKGIGGTITTVKTKGLKKQ